KKLDSGTLSLSRGATHTGQTRIEGGTLKLIASGGLPDGGYVVVAPGGTWDLNDRNDTIFDLSSVFGVGGGTVDLGGGTLRVAWGNFDGTITGDGGLTKYNADLALWLNGPNSYKGQTRINAGELVITHDTALGTADGNTTVSDGAALILRGGVTVTGETLALRGSPFPIEPGALRNAAGDNTWDGQIVLQGDAMICAASGSLTLKQAIGGPGYVLTLDGNGSGAVEGPICGGTDSVIKTGAGTWTLSGANSYLGPTTVRGGVLQLGEDNRLLDTSDLVITGGTFGLNGHDEILDALRGTGGTLDLEGGTLAIGVANSNATYAGHITGDGNMVKWGNSTQTLTGRCTLRGELTIREGILNVQFPLEPNRPSRVRVTAGTVLELEDAGDWIAPMTIDGTGISDSGAVRVVSGENSLGGITLAHHSTIRLESGTNLHIYGDPAVTSEGKDLTIVTDGDAQCLLFGPIAIGAGTVTKEGTGSMDLIGGSTHTGLTDVVAGTLLIWDGNSLGTTDGGTVVRAGAELELSPQHGDIHVGAESLRISGSGPTGWAAFASRTGDNTWSGTVTLDADATIACNTDSLTLDACTAVTGAGRDLTLSGEGEGTISGKVEIGSGGIIKLDDSTWTLTTANPYTGTTTIDAGALRIEDANALGGTSHGTVVRNGGALEMQGDIHVPAEPLSLRGYGVDLNGALRSLDGVNSYAGDITLEANSMIGVDWGQLTLLGRIGESEPNLGFYKVGVGQLLLKESNLFTGFLGILEGSVISD
ncbi:MAG: autotransporter-associated beta strand repeat-containing protein, partial [Phycisphaerae bacterium]